MDPHWLHALWFGYWVPSLWGNGPEAITQTIVYGLLALILIPPVRRFMRAEFHKVHEKIEAVHETVKDHHAQAEAARKHHEDLLNHIIKHSPDIPEFGAAPAKKVTKRAPAKRTQ